MRRAPADRSRAAHEGRAAGPRGRPSTDEAPRRSGRRRRPRRPSTARGRSRAGRLAAGLLAAGSIAATLAAAGCSMEPSPARQMREAIEPFLDEHARFDRWARRVSLGDAAFRTRAALQEAAFAPLRGQRRVVCAWLTREGPDARELRFPTHAPDAPTDGWVRVRVGDYGELDAQRRSLALGDDSRPLTLIRRSRPAPGGATLHVTLGFSAEPAPP